MRASRRPGQVWKRRIVAADQRFFLFPPPAFDTALAGDGVFEPLKVLSPHQCHRPARARITGKAARLMFRQPFVQASSRNADIIRIVAAAEHIDVDIHLAREK